MEISNGNVLSLGTLGLDDTEIDTLSFLLGSYNVRLERGLESADLAICKGMIREVTDKPSIRIPTNRPASDGSNSGISQDHVIVLPSNPLEVPARRFNQVMNGRLSLVYRLSTRLPFHYHRVPPIIRNLLFKAVRPDWNLGNHLSVEVDRRILLDGFAKLGFGLTRRRPPRLIVTHDVDSEKGMDRARLIEQVDDEVGVETIWFIVSHDYPISGRIVKQLAERSSIGSHDTRHDGRLIGITNQDELVERLKKSRTTLETVCEVGVDSFRAPLLQFDRKIAIGLESAGYRRDFSLPTWEPVHPTRMGGFGVESCQPFRIGGIVEHPLSLFQDHQVFQVLGMNTKEAVNFWIGQARLIKEFSGDAILSVHPDHRFGDDLERYRTLLLELSSIFAA